MADVKNFGIRGIGADVQFGKSGGRVVYDSGNSLFKVTTDGTTLGNVNVATPTADDHAANKAYVDSVASGLDVKDSVRAASTTDVNTATPPTSIDGVTLSAGDRILLKDQSTDTQNGIYIYDSTGLTRAGDMDQAGEFVGAFFFVEEGTVNSDQGYVMTTDGPITVGTSSIAFTKFTGTGQITTGDALSKSGNTLNVNVDDTYVMVNGSDELTVKGTTTTGEVLQSDGSGGVAYGQVDLTSASAVSGALGLANGGLGVDASQTSGKATARTNLGLGTMSVQDANSVAITGGTIDMSGGTLTLANDQLSGDVISGGTIDSASLQGGTGVTISQFDITVGNGKTLDVDGVLDVDGAAGSAIDNVTIGATTSAAGTFSTMTSDSADINGGNIDGTVIGATTAANATFADANVTGTLYVDTVDAYSGGNITFNSLIVTTQGIDVANAGISGAGTTTTGTLNVDNINEKTSGNGVTIDGVLIKDGDVDADSGTIDDFDTANATVTGGTVDGTVIGGTTSAAGTFSTMTTASAAITGGSVSGTSIDMTGQTLTFDNDAISGDKIDGGTISDFASTGIDDNATSTQVTVADSGVTFGADVTVTGDLTVNGTLTSINTTNTEISDNTIVLNNGETAAGVTAGSAGFFIDRGTADNATLLWNETDDVFELKVGTALADLKIGSQVMDAISVDTINEKTNGAGITIADAVSGTDATFSGTVTTDTIAENSAGNGVAIDGASIKDGVLTGGVTLGATDTADLSAGTLTLANDQISGDSIEGGTIGSITITSASLTSADIDGGTVDGATIGGSTSGAGTFSTMTTDSADINGGAIDGAAIGANASSTAEFTTMKSDSVDVNGGNIDGTIIGATTPAAGTFSTLNSSNAQITGGAISGADLTSSVVDFDGGAMDDVVIGAATSAAGTFSTLTTNNASVTGGSVAVTTLSGTNFSTGNASVTGGSISGTDVDMTGKTLTLDADSINGDKVHGGSISAANLAGTAGNTISGYDITVGAGKTLDVSGGTLTVANDQISGDAIDGGTISDFSSTGIDDTATTATVMTLTDTAATFGVAGDFGTNDLDAGAATLASLTVSGDAVVQGDLTVSGNVTTTLSETVNIEDNTIVLNSNETGAPTQDGGIEVNRGTSDNATVLWNETSDAFEMKVGTAAADLTINDLTVSEITLTNALPLDMGGTHTDTSGYAASSLMTMDGSGGVTEMAKGANSTVLKVNGSGALGYAQVDLTADVTGALPIANGGTNLTSAGSDRKVMFSDGSAFAMEYIQEVRNSSGVKVIDTANASSGTAEFLDITNAAGKLTLTSKNASGSGTVDMYLQGQNGGDVYIVGQSGEALIQGEADADLTVSGGDASSGAAGDLVLKGGNGGASGASGAVVVKGGNGGSADGNVQIMSADDEAIATFTATASAVDHFEFHNGTGGVELHSEGTTTDVNITLAPKGDGLVIAPSGYDMSSGGNKAFATKDYVDGAAAGSVDFGVRRVSFAANGSSSFTVGTVANVSGKTYYVAKVTVKVTTAFVGADELVISDGSNTLVGANDVDLSEGGIYMIDLGYENATSGGATISASIQNGGSSASPSTGNVIVTAEYKQV